MDDLCDPPGTRESRSSRGRGGRRLQGHGACSQNGTMASRRVLGGLLLLAVGSGAAIACTNYEPPDVANYGPPNGINGKTPNGPPAAAPTGTGTSNPPPSSDGGGAPAGDSGGGGPPPASNLACVTAGGTLVADAGCAVSWSKDIFPKMAAGGAWNCAGASCHAAGNPPVLPADAHGMYTTLTAYTGTATTGAQAGQYYFNPCSTDPAKSTFSCNLQPAASGGCGSLQMPLGITVAAAGMTAVSTWVACGAPEN